jgi:hypothetical protein
LHPGAKEGWQGDDDDRTGSDIWRFVMNGVEGNRDKQQMSSATRWQARSFLTQAVHTGRDQPQPETGPAHHGLH